MGDVKQIINAKIAGKKVMVFSKTTCPFCKMAKRALKGLVRTDNMEIWEIDNESAGRQAQIQTVLQKMTGARTVPRVFVNGKCIGGGDETVAMANSGQLGKLLNH